MPLSSMAITDDGGPAFPGLSHQHRDSYGMSLRDYFAAKAIEPAIHRALNAMAAQIKPDAFDFARVAQTAYRMADAMLEARKR